MSCYCWSWCSLTAITPGLFGFQHPETTPFNSNHTGELNETVYFINFPSKISPEMLYLVHGVGVKAEAKKFIVDIPLHPVDGWCMLKL